MLGLEQPSSVSQQSKWPRWQQTDPVRGVRTTIWGPAMFSGPHHTLWFSDLKHHATNTACKWQLTRLKPANEWSQKSISVDLDHHEQSMTVGDFMLVRVISKQGRRNDGVAVNDVGAWHTETQLQTNMTSATSQKQCSDTWLIPRKTKWVLAVGKPRKNLRQI